jgi:hypothetical protein
MNYVEEVADKFRESCPNEVILGPADFTLIAEWEKQEIPKEVVIDAIGELSEPGVHSVADIRSGVKEYFVNWLQEQRSAEVRR